MPWAVRRRILYLLGVFLFLAAVIGGPIAYLILSQPPTCSDGVQNQGETSVDRGGPCALLDATALQPSAVLWARSFKVRDGSYNVAAYIENPNEQAGATTTPYLFELYDANNILIAERAGTTYIMPGRVTPVFEGDIDTGNRIATRALFRLTSSPRWAQMYDPARAVAVSDITAENSATAPRVSAQVRNTAVAPLFDIGFIAVVFDTAGNAYAASATKISRLEAGAITQIVFTWPSPFPTAIGRIDIIPRLEPLPSVSQ